jgi:hypothetical protein
MCHRSSRGAGLLSLQEQLSKELYLLPEEKYVLLRSLPHLMWLIDGDSQAKAAGSKVGFHHRFTPEIL